MDKELSEPLTVLSVAGRGSVGRETNGVEARGVEAKR